MAKGFASTLTSKQNQKETQVQEVQSIQQIQENLLTYVEELTDPRKPRTQKHLFKGIITIAILAVIGGAQGWEDIENYGISKYSWLKEFLELPNGIPSDDTFRRVFERLAPDELGKILSRWVQTLMGSLTGEIVSLDGKCIRGSYDRNQGIKALSLLTAFAGEQKLILEQVKVEEKSNEITAIPVLLNLLDIQGAVVTIDAIGTQVEIVQQIHSQKADYVLSLKKNHPTFYQQVAEQFKSLSTLNHLETIDYEERIENQVHWVLDVTFREDSCRIRSGHSPHNFSLLRRLALNILRQETSFRRSLCQKQKRTAMDNDYMIAVLQAFCQA